MLPFAKIIENSVQDEPKEETSVSYVFHCPKTIFLLSVRSEEKSIYPPFTSEFGFTLTENSPYPDNFAVDVSGINIEIFVIAVARLDLHETAAKQHAINAVNKIKIVIIFFILPSFLILTDIRRVCRSVRLSRRV